MGRKRGMLFCNFNRRLWGESLEGDLMWVEGDP